MSILKDLSELVGAGVITDETAQRITGYYQQKRSSAPNRLLLLFGILGALLVGIGVLFIVANQWDDLSQPLKISCAFLLLVVPQLVAGWVMALKSGKIIWRESSGLLLFFAVGANISLLSQIFQINGDTSSYLLTWYLLTWPLIYLLDSPALAAAGIIMLLFYRFAVAAGGAEPYLSHLFWLLFALPMPGYLLWLRKAPDYLMTTLLHWAIPFVLAFSIGIVIRNHPELMSPAHLSLFGIFILAGNLPLFSGKPIIRNGYKIIGIAGTVISLLMMTFRQNWKKLAGSHYTFENLVATPEVIAGTVLFLLALFFLIRQYRYKPVAGWKLEEITFLLFVPVFILGAYSSAAWILVNLQVLAWAVLLIRKGSLQNHLGVLNTGMIILTLLVVCRAFDTDVSFVVKGSLFVLVGLGFFAANWLMLKKRKENEA